MKDRANLIWFLVVLMLCLTVLAIAGAVGVAQGGTGKITEKHTNTHLGAAAQAPLLRQLNAADNPEPDPSDSLGTGLLVLVVGLAAIWTFQARREWRGRLISAEPSARNGSPPLSGEWQPWPAHLEARQAGARG